MPSLAHSSTGFAYAGAPARVSTATVFGRVRFLIAVALGFLAGGTIIGKDLSQGAALACSSGGLRCCSSPRSAGAPFRVGAFAIGWLYALALLIGLGLGHGPQSRCAPPRCGAHLERGPWR